MQGITFIVLAVINISLFNQALTQSPRWFDDYGLYGMQYGTKQLFEEAIPDRLAQNPKMKILVTSTWANGADRFLDFFFTQEELSRVRMDNVQTYLFSKMPLSGDEVFVMTPAEYQEAIASPKFSQVRVEQTIYYPDSSPGFLFVRLAYAPEADAIFAAEKEARSQLVEAQVMLNGQLVTVRHSMIDMGSPDLIFDGDLFTLMRGLEANPFVLEVIFPAPQSFSKVQADFGLAEITMTAFLYPDDQAVPLRYETKRSDSESKDTLMTLDLSGSPLVTRIRFEILNRTSGDITNIHIRELSLVP